MLSLFLSALPLQPASIPPPAPSPAPPIDCATVRVGYVGALAPWLTPRPATPVLQPGTAYDVTGTAPLTLEIAEAGTYGIALDQGAWIDVARDGATLRSTAHGHGPQCSGIRKIVDFQLQPGRYTITLTRTQGPTLRLLVIHR